MAERERRLVRLPSLVRQARAVPSRQARPMANRERNQVRAVPLRQAPPMAARERKLVRPPKRDRVKQALGALQNWGAQVGDQVSQSPGVVLVPPQHRLVLAALLGSVRREQTHPVRPRVLVCATPAVLPGYANTTATRRTPAAATSISARQGWRVRSFAAAQGAVRSWSCSVRVPTAAQWSAWASSPAKSSK